MTTTSSLDPHQAYTTGDPDHLAHVVDRLHHQGNTAADRGAEWLATLCWRARIEAMSRLHLDARQRERDGSLA